jgi:hypothetical protein
LLQNDVALMGPTKYPDQEFTIGSALTNNIVNGFEEIVAGWHPQITIEYTTIRVSD